MNPFRPHPTQHTFTQRSPAAERVRRRTVAFIILAALVPLNSQARLATSGVSSAAAAVPSQQANTGGGAD